jgi:hypothetical protein
MATVKRCNVQQAQVEHELDQTIKAADPLRAESLQKLQRVRTIKTKNQERERLRLSTKLGDQHPRVMTLQAKIDTNYEVVRNLNMESVRAKTEIPTVESDDWLVHGRVLNERLEGVPGMKAALYDRSGCPIETCGSEITDKTGYFNLTIKNAGKGVREKTEVKKKTSDETRSANAENIKTIDDTRESVTTEKSPGAFLYVLDRNDVIVHRDKRPLTVVPGQAQYLEVVLADEEIGLPPLPNTRYLGNSHSRELHDLNNQQPACQIDEIRVDHGVGFNTQKEALALKYDFCAYCFGKDKSKR